MKIGQLTIGDFMPWRLTGPIFDKELRVSSRRKRNYFLRIAYMLILMTIVLFIWAQMIDVRYGNAIYQISRLSEAGLYITFSIVVFQFYAVQILAAIMLSNSISDEIYNKTLGVLMSTPITSVQIIMGKLLSKLLQIGLLLCLTLPILGIVRVFGGVPWEFLMTSFCVTITAVLFAAMVSINWSIQFKYTYGAIIASILTLFGLYVLFPLFTGWIIDEFINSRLTAREFYGWLCHFNPLITMQYLLDDLSNAKASRGSANVWWINCLVMLTGSLLLFIRASIVVRKKALQEICGHAGASGKKKKNGKMVTINTKLRPVRGNPLLWKELRKPTIRGGKVKKTVIRLIAVVGLFFAYFIAARENELHDSGMHMLFILSYLLIGLFYTTIVAATTITSERHSQNWPMLMGTLLSDWSILHGKLAGVVCRSLPIWLILFGHVIVFIFAGCLHPTVLLHLLLIVIPMILITCSSGIFFSTLLKRTTSSVICNLAFIAFIWVGLLALVAILDIFSGSDMALSELLLSCNPFFHLGQAIFSAGGTTNAGRSLMQLSYDTVMGDDVGFMAFTFGLCVINTINVLIAYMVLAIAKSNFRERIFR